MASIPVVEKPVVIFMEPSTTKIGFALGDAFRVGELKTEAAYAVLYKVPMDRFILPKTKNEIKGERIYHFYYDGEELRRKKWRNNMAREEVYWKKRLIIQ